MPAPRASPGAVARDVEERLHPPLLLRGHRREQQFVAAAEHRPAQHGLGAPRHGERRGRREQQRHHRAGTETERQHRDRTADAESLLQRSGHRGLDQERDDLDDRVEDREELQQMAAFVLGRRARLQQVVHDRGTRRTEDHEQRDLLHLGRGTEDLRPEHRLHRRRGAWPIAQGPTQRPQAGRAQRVQSRQQQQRRVGRRPRCHALHRQSPDDAAKRPGRGDAHVLLPGRVRVEQLAREGPEAREQQRPERRDVDVDDDRDRGAGAEPVPLGHVPDRTRQEPQRHQPLRPQPRQQVGVDRHREHGEQRREDHHPRQVGDRHRAEEQGVADGLARDLVRQHDGRHRHGHAREGSGVHGSCSAYQHW